LFCEDGGSSFASVLFYGHELTLLIFEILIFGLVDIASHSYVLAAAVTFFIMEVDSTHFEVVHTVQFFIQPTFGVL